MDDQDEIERDRMARLLAKVAASRKLQGQRPMRQPDLSKCPYCRASVRRDRLNTHIDKAHPYIAVPNRRMPTVAELIRRGGAAVVTCPTCKAAMRADQLRAHFDRRHGSLKSAAPLQPSSSIRVSEVDQEADARSNKVQPFSLKERKPFSGETWDARLFAIKSHADVIEAFISRKWADIRSCERVFGLSVDRSYEIKVASAKFRTFGLESIVFRQALNEAPFVLVEFVLQNENWFFRLDSNGRLHSHRQDGLISMPEEYRLLLNLGAVLHLADLVIPIQYSPDHGERMWPQSRATSRENHSHPERLIPRRVQDRSTAIPPSSRGRITDACFVDPFRRRLPLGQSASFEKIVEADQFGINLQGPGYPDIQYTFVSAHVRGDTTEQHQPVYQSGYRAVRTLDTILTMLGF